jgi:hypothetical protein
MWTTILAYLIALMGLVTIATGLASFGVLLTAKGIRVPLRYYAVSIGLIAGGFSMVGVAQCLRLLLLLIATATAQGGARP